MAVVDDLSNMSDGTYSALEPRVLLRLYNDLHTALGKTVALGDDIIAEIDAQYQAQADESKERDG
jgi:hypothetical protein